MSELERWRSWIERVLAALRRGGTLSVIVCSAVVGTAVTALVLWGQHRVQAVTSEALPVLPRAVRVTTSQPPPDPLVVHVAGAVLRPGLVQLPEGARVADALAAAGGLSPDADTAKVNLAEKVLDGARIYVAHQGEANPPPVIAAGSSGGGSAAPSATRPIDLNAATAAELDALPGVGPATAAAIVAYREQHGPFASVDGLAEVRGIGPAKLDALRPLVRV